MRNSWKSVRCFPGWYSTGIWSTPKKRIWFGLRTSLQWCNTFPRIPSEVNWFGTGFAQIGNIWSTGTFRNLNHTVLQNSTANYLYSCIKLMISLNLFIP